MPPNQQQPMPQSSPPTPATDTPPIVQESANLPPPSHLESLGDALASQPRYKIEFLPTDRNPYTLRRIIVILIWSIICVLIVLIPPAGSLLLVIIPCWFIVVSVVIWQFHQDRKRGYFVAYSEKLYNKMHARLMKQRNSSS
ncbi:hypothetical protein FWF48_03710 [Candidatus Saccharibacteria bacterium]|nr:hypothetical protein [Candidatus Saccharibacteria bacterium]